MNSVVAALLLWINANSPYHYTGEPPVVQTTDPEALIYLVLGEVPRIPDKARSGIRGLYDSETRTIWLRDDFNPEDPENRAHLVHELVHFLQHASGVSRPFRCQRELEREAYELQSKYLVANNLPPVDTAATRWSRSLTGCAAH